MSEQDFRELLHVLADTGVVRIAGGDDVTATPPARIDFLVEEDGPGSPSSTNMAKVIGVLERFAVSLTTESDDRVVAQTSSNDDRPVMLVFSRPDQTEESPGLRAVRATPLQPAASD